MTGFDYFGKREKIYDCGVPSKNIIIFGNCHFQEIQRNIIQYQEIRDNYLPYYICINSYVDVGASLSAKQYFTLEHINLFKKADIIIYQNIESDRGFLNNKEVEKLIPKNCIKIKIPHYRSSIYHYSFYETPYFEEMKQLVDKEETVNQKITCIKDFIKNINETTQDTKSFDEFITKEITHFKKINSYSDINMYNFFISNWKNIKLFMGRSYPSSYFIFILTKKILEKLNIYENLTFETTINNKTVYPRYFAQHTDFPMFDFWYEFNKFTFDKQYYWELEIPMEDYEFYYLHINIYNKFGKDKIFNAVVFIRSQFNGLEEVKKLRNLIKL
jgi:hypothetical protein